MSKYSCDLCAKTFTRKAEYSKHIKTPCLDENADDKSKLITLFDSCLNILRDVEGITNIKALRNLSYLIVLRLIEPRLDENFDNYNYDMSKYGDATDKEKENYKKELLRIARFSNLVNEKDENIPSLLKNLWEDILSQYPETKFVFYENGNFDIKYQNTYRKLIEKLNSYNMLNSSYDILGNAYEAVIQNASNNRGLGQFFTQPIVKNFMINLINPKVFQDGTIEKIADLAMGTGGFLISSIKYIINKAKNMNIELDWNQIIKEGIYGRELESDTYQFAMSNMLISTGRLFDKLENGDSIRKSIKNNFDIILSNPPFGITSLVYEDFNYTEKELQLPIESNNSIGLFLQKIIYMLKIEGRAAVVVSNGKELYAKTKSLMDTREYLMKTCDLKEVIHLPPGIFTYTSIKTCILYFVKKVEDPFYYKNITTKGRGKMPDRIKEVRYFEDELQTEKVDFYDFNIADSSKTLLISVPGDTIKNNLYSLKYEDYAIKEKPKILNENIEYKKLGEICEFKNGYAFKSESYEKIKTNHNLGLVKIKAIQNYKIDTSKISEYINIEEKLEQFKLTKEDVIIALTGATIGKIAIYNLDNESYMNQRICKFIAKNNTNIKYIFYWYINYNIIDIILSLAGGTAQSNISSDDILLLEIPIPPIEFQNKIVQDLDFVYDKLIKTTEENIKGLETYNKMYLETSLMIKDIESKKLGDVCEINYGTRIVKDKSERGKYPVYGSGNITFYTDEFNREGFNILIGRFALSLECVRLVNHELYLNDSGLTVKPINIEVVLHKYLGHFLINNNELIYNCARGSAQKNLNMDDFRNIEIPIPPIEVQNKIVSELDKNNEIINELKNKIESYKTYAKEYLDKCLSQ